ncbi:hypothetical protein CEXT_24201 [Caerostris extrusa]|uniref:Uncharacterized protein n=1 Tax=Caerostris extrusa TaxID=172846 RepID=A0AAV4SHY7_CAEEX|nr:hypothetical protein CEXT_24201 [Caerostris extrusa]
MKREKERKEEKEEETGKEERKKKKKKEKKKKKKEMRKKKSKKKKIIPPGDSFRHADMGQLLKSFSFIVGCSFWTAFGAHKRTKMAEKEREENLGCLLEIP